MTNRPILFTGPMVRAILDGRKTQTRRILIMPKYRGHSDFGHSETPGYDWHFRDKEMRWHDIRQSRLMELLPVAAGDQLYVREAWRTLQKFDCLAPRHLADDPSKVTFEADPERRNPLWAFGRLRPGIHMPRWASRLTLIVTDVRVQRLQDISEADAKAEGCPCQSDDDLAGMDAWGWFRDLWDGINAKRGFGWDANPWVCTISFTVNSMNIDAMPEFKAA